MPADLCRTTSPATTAPPNPPPGAAPGRPAATATGPNGSSPSPAPGLAGRPHSAQSSWARSYEPTAFRSSRGPARLAAVADMGNPKTVLHHYLQESRDALVWKLDGLDECQARLPRTPTGNNLLGVVKHCLNVEAGYFGPTFGRELPMAQEVVPMEAFEIGRAAWREAGRELWAGVGT